MAGSTATQTPSQKAAAAARAAEKADKAKGASKPKSSGAARPPKGGRPAADASKATRRTKSAAPKGTRQNPNRPERPKLKGSEVTEVKGSDLTDWLASFVKEHGSSSHDAPIAGDPFVAKGRLYLKADPLRAHIDTDFGFALTPKQARDALAELKFERNPFPVRINGKQTGASHYSAATGNLPKPVKDALPAEREPAQRKSAENGGEETTE